MLAFLLLIRVSLGWCNPTLTPPTIIGDPMHLCSKPGQEIQRNAIGPAEANLRLVLAARGVPARPRRIVLLKHHAGALPAQEVAVNPALS